MKFLTKLGGGRGGGTGGGHRDKSGNGREGKRTEVVTKSGDNQVR